MDQTEVHVLRVAHIRDITIDGPPPASPIVKFADGVEIHPAVVFPPKGDTTAHGPALRKELLEKVLALAQLSTPAPQYGVAVVTYKLASGEEAYAIACRQGTTVDSVS